MFGQGMRGEEEKEMMSLPLPSYAPLPISYCSSSPCNPLSFLSLPKQYLMPLKLFLGIFSAYLPILPLEYLIKYPVNWFELVLK